MEYNNYNLIIFNYFILLFIPTLFTFSNDISVKESGTY